MKNLFFDMEFTGLHKNTTAISLAIVSECGSSFYAEFNDYDETQVDEWLQENVINKLTLEDMFHEDVWDDGKLHTKCCGDSAQVQDELETWLTYMIPGQQATSLNTPNQFRMVSDCMHYDMVLFLEIWGGATMNGTGAPACIYYIPTDICTMFTVAGVDPDCNREEFGGRVYHNANKHHAMHDAVVIKDCYANLTEMLAWGS